MSSDFHSPFKALLSVVAALIMAEVLEAAPRELMAEYNRAWQMVGQMRLDEGIAALKGIIAKDRDFYRAYRTLAEAYRKKGRADEAERYFRELLSKEPTNAWASFGLGELCRAVRQQQCAAAHYERCIQSSATAHACYAAWIDVFFDVKKRSVTRADVERRFPGGANRTGVRLAVARMLRSPYRTEGIAIAEAGLRIARSKGDDELAWWFDEELVASLNDQARLRACQKDMERIARDIGDTDRQLRSSEVLHHVFFAARDFERSGLILNQLLDTTRQLGHKVWEARVLLEKGAFHYFRGDHEEALRCYFLARTRFEEAKEPGSAANAVLHAGSAYETLGELRKAEQCFLDFMLRVRSLGDRWMEAFACEGWGMSTARRANISRHSTFYRRRFASFERSAGVRTPEPGCE